MRFSALCAIIIKTQKEANFLKKEKRELTEEEKQARKENIQGWLCGGWGGGAFILAFAFYGMQSSLFGGG